MGFLPMEADLLPPSDDRVFKLILTAPEAGPLLTDLIRTAHRSTLRCRPAIFRSMPTGNIKT